MKREMKLWTILIAVFTACTSVLQAASERTLIADYEQESSYAYAEPAQMDGQAGVAVMFEGTKDMHYYATAEAAPAPGMELKIEAAAEKAIFGKPVYPAYAYFDDPVKGRIEMWAGNFTIFVPLEKQESPSAIDVTVTISGMVCTSKVCLAPFEKSFSANLDFSKPAMLRQLAFERSPAADRTVDTSQTVKEQTIAKPADQADEGSLSEMLHGWSERGLGTAAVSTPVIWYLGLAALAGLSINIMPCVLPVVPLIILRLVGQAKESPGRRVGLGLAFCAGIILFFAIFAAVSAAVKLATGTALDLNSLYRSPTAVTVMFLLIVLFALVLLDVVQITLPGFSTGQNKQAGCAGSVGMGFLAGILSTPCSGAIIGAVLVWAQTQTIWVSGLALVLMGFGMALPYALLVAMPKWLSIVPKPGTWMEIFKKTGGFLLLAIAFKFMLAGLAKEHLLNVLLYGVVFAFSAWMWGSWVSFNTPAARKWMVRGIALVIAIAAGAWMLPRPQEAKIEWQTYDAVAIEEALEGGRPVLVKFTADWCTNCKVVERRVYQQPEIAKLLADRGFVTVKADTTQADFPAAVDMRRVFGEPGNVPVTMLLDPRNKSIMKLRGIFRPQQLASYLTADFAD
jgi:thiol:disulfide interchange protein DsbD